MALGFAKKSWDAIGMANWTQAAVDALSTAVNSRRAFLGRSQLEVWRAGGPANSTLTSVEGAVSLTIKPSTLRKLDVGLDWQAGTAIGILKGEINPTAAGRSHDYDFTFSTPNRNAYVPEHPAVDNTDDEIDELDAVENLVALVAQGWRQARVLADAVAAVPNPADELLAAARDVVHFIDSYLIIQILDSGYAKQMEKWLERIYRERTEIFRQLSVGEPRFPWLTAEELSSDNPQSGDDPLRDAYEETVGLVGGVQPDEGDDKAI